MSAKYPDVSLKLTAQNEARELPFPQAFDLCRQAIEAGDLRAGVFMTRQLVAQLPEAVPVLWLHAVALDLLGGDDLSARLSLCEQALSLDETHSEFACMRSDLLRRLERCDEAIDSLQGILRQNSNDAGLYLELGQCYREKGRKAEAEKSFRSALYHDRNRVAAWFFLQDIAEFTHGDLKAMLALHRKKNLQPRERTHLCFALAGYWRQQKDVNSESIWLARGNANQKLEQPYEAKLYSRLVEEHIKRFTRSYFESVPVVSQSTAQPIFVIGMPRTGSTLMEKILSSHSRVTALGESAYMEQVLRQRAATQEGSHGIFPSMIPEVPSTKLVAIRDDYMALVKQRPLTAMVTDKSLDNFQILGLLKLVFPEAKFIHMVRHPLDTILSCYQHSFSRLPFANDLVDLAHYYVDYRRLMDHWQSIWTDAVLTVRYEALVKKPEIQIREISQYLGLEWEDSLLKFSENTGATRTASQLQVKSGLYQSSIGGWQSYKKMLGPVASILKKEGVLEYPQSLSR